ncbi:hypothetical protein [Nocardiopsis trehalosi]|uniref:hypothetical protein n=1 Tax=Nocardiopsis trehalosi TaxID=109329 RepID=UPI0012FACBF2|nr:hypothetical protein [Nocardiopsis trehalosi]
MPKQRRRREARERGARMVEAAGPGRWHQVFATTDPARMRAFRERAAERLRGVPPELIRLDTLCFGPPPTAEYRLSVFVPEGRPAPDLRDAEPAGEPRRPR